VKSEEDPLDPTPVPAMRESVEAMRYIDRVVTGAGGIALRYGIFCAIGSAPSARMRSAFPGDLEVPITSWPRSVNVGTSLVPITPKTRIVVSFRHVCVSSRVYLYDPTRRRNVTDG
jgi:hypothetical protein